MSFLSDISKFDRAKLKETETIVTTVGGTQLVESKNAVTHKGTKVGFVLSSGKDNKSTSQSPEDEDSDDGKVVDSIEISYNNSLHPPDESELRLRTEWHTLRNTLGDGFYCKSQRSTIKCAIFVLKKERFEDHFDTFAFILHEHYSIYQVDHDDIVSGILTKENFRFVIFPGGLIFDVEKHLSHEGGLIVSKYIHEGGNFLGVCAGALLAVRDGYTNADTTCRMLGARATWAPGVGTASVRFTDEGRKIFRPSINNSSPSSDEKEELFFANGPVFKVSTKEKHLVMNVPLDQCSILATYTNISTNEMKSNFEGMGEYNGAVVCGHFGKGRVVAFGPHPEASGLKCHKLIISAINWLINI